MNAAFNVTAKYNTVLTSPEREGEREEREGGVMEEGGRNGQNEEEEKRRGEEIDRKGMRVGSG